MTRELDRRLRRLEALERRTGQGKDRPVLWVGPSWEPVAGWTDQGELTVMRLPGEGDQYLKARTLREAAALGKRPVMFVAINLSGSG